MGKSKLFSREDVLKKHTIHPQEDKQVNWKISASQRYRLNVLKAQLGGYQYHMADICLDLYEAFGSLSKEDRELVIKASKHSPMFAADVAKLARAVMETSKYPKSSIATK